MFSSIFRPDRIDTLIRQVTPERAEVDAVLSNDQGLSLEEAAVLLRAERSPRLRHRIIAAAAELRAMCWDGQLFLMPPLYISDGDPERGGCQDHCGYCPWRNGNVPEADLLRLTDEEIFAETRVLLGRGYEDVELVAATDPPLFRGEHTAAAVAAARAAGAQGVGINFFPLGAAQDYRQAVEAGCSFVVVWQETYAPQVYAAAHPRGPKANMRHRLDAHDRAMQGGVPAVGVAFLGGLGDWRFDALATIWHALYLQKTYKAKIIFGMPRYKGGPVASVDLQPYSDWDYVFVGALYSLALPSALPWFSTRESFDLSEVAAAGGGCLFTLDCSTVVGGYTRRGSPQFPVHSMPFASGVPRLLSRGFRPQTRLCRSGECC